MEAEEYTPIQFLWESHIIQVVPSFMLAHTFLSEGFATFLVFLPPFGWISQRLFIRFLFRG